MKTDLLMTAQENHGVITLINELRQIRINNLGSYINLSHGKEYKVTIEEI